MFNSKIKHRTQFNKKTKSVQKKAILPIAFCAVYFVVAIVFIYKLIKINLIMEKYVFIIGAILLVMGIIMGLLAFSKKKLLHIIEIIFSATCILLLLYITNFITKSDNVLRKLFSLETESTTYYVMTIETNNITSLEDLKSKKIGIMIQNSDNLKEHFSNYDFEYVEFNYIGLLTNVIQDNKVDAVIIDCNTYELLKEINETLYKKLKKIHEFELEVDDVEITVDEQITENESEKNEPQRNPNLLKDVDMGNCFILYISGIDGGGYIRPYGLSDVNMLAIVNPDAYKIQLISVPRDFYVTIPGRGGQKDKLTHAGLYGTNTSIATMEQLFGIDIDYYIKVTFGALETIVDDIGGISVYSDTEFDSFHMKGWHVNKGYNYMDGKKALAYSRERYAYGSGDRHRIKNQQDVISAIIKKIEANPQQLLKVNEILNNINPYMANDIPYSTIQNLVKKQISSLKPWSIDIYNVNGTDAQKYTASFPDSLTYVMYPIESTIITAQNKILSVINSH